MTQQVHAPYHFVPLSSWVYLPQWAHLVSHDYPFQEGLSGVIEYTLTNHTHLLVGGNTKKDPHNKKPTEVDWARDPQGNPIIPGTSIKGMLRSFLEIATFGKFSQVDDQRFSYRDMNTKSGFLNFYKNTDIKSAWLKFDNSTKQWTLRYCKNAKIYYQDLNKQIKKRGKNTHLTNATPAEAEKKYKEWPLSEAPFTFDTEYRPVKGGGADWAINMNHGKHHGHPVFTSTRVGGGKHLEFCYLFYAEDAQTHKVDSNIVTTMFEAHSKELVDYLKKHPHPNLGIPVFAALHKSNKTVEALGFTKLPKLRRDKSVHELLQAQQQAAMTMGTFDFCDLLFGCVNDYGHSLKSRVQFGDAQLAQAPANMHKELAILQSPKASYANAYIEQNQKATNNYEAGSKLAGWKRYPVQAKFKNNLAVNKSDNKGIQNKLELLAPQHRFKGRIIFHNLLPQELGSLLWALQPESEFFHGLGHGKSLGAGAITLQYKLTTHTYNTEQQISPEEAIASFIEHMNQVYPSKDTSSSRWLNSPQVQHLLAFGNQADNKSKKLSYMPLEEKSRGMNYVRSTKEKKPLPKWVASGQPLSREEKLEQQALMIPNSGRLQHLFKQLEANQQLSQEEKQGIDNYNAMQLEREREGLKANASPLFLSFLEIYMELEPFFGAVNTPGSEAANQQAARAKKLASVIEQAIADESCTLTELQEILAFATAHNKSGFYDANAKPKRKSNAAKQHRERKQLLEQLAAKIAAF